MHDTTRIYDNATVQTTDDAYEAARAELVGQGRVVHLTTTEDTAAGPLPTLSVPRRAVESIQIVCADATGPDGLHDGDPATVRWTAPLGGFSEACERVTLFYDGWLRVVTPTGGADAVDWTLTDYPPHAYTAVRWEREPATAAAEVSVNAR